MDGWGESSCPGNFPAQDPSEWEGRNILLAGRFPEAEGEGGPRVPGDSGATRGLGMIACGLQPEWRGAKTIGHFPGEARDHFGGLGMAPRSPVAAIHVSSAVRRRRAAAGSGGEDGARAMGWEIFLPTRFSYLKSAGILR